MDITSIALLILVALIVLTCLGFARMAYKGKPVGWETEGWLMWAGFWFVVEIACLTSWMKR
jgi:hypothetical protein